MSKMTGGQVVETFYNAAWGIKTVLVRINGAFRVDVFGENNVFHKSIYYDTLSSATTVAKMIAGV